MSISKMSTPKFCIWQNRLYVLSYFITHNPQCWNITHQTTQEGFINIKLIFTFYMCTEHGMVTQELEEWMISRPTLRFHIHSNHYHVDFYEDSHNNSCLEGWILGVDILGIDILRLTQVFSCYIATSTCRKWPDTYIFCCFEPQCTHVHLRKNTRLSTTLPHRKHWKLSLASKLVLHK